MPTPTLTRPHFPKGYVDQPSGTVAWDYVEQRLTAAKNYWLCSVRPNGSPHAVPRWAVWVNGKIFYDGSPETRHAQNITQNPRVSLHLESGDEVIIVEGEAKAAGKPPRELAEQLAQAYRAKYTAHGYAPEAKQWDEGGLYELTPRTVLAWTKFTEDPTKFVFDS